MITTSVHSSMPDSHMLSLGYSVMRQNCLSLTLKLEYGARLRTLLLYTTFYLLTFSFFPPPHSCTTTSLEGSRAYFRCTAPRTWLTRQDVASCVRKFLLARWFEELQLDAICRSRTSQSRLHQHHLWLWPLSTRGARFMSFLGGNFEVANAKEWSRMFMKVLKLVT